MRIVLDTNCLVPVIVPGSPSNDVWQAFRKGLYTLCVSTEILLEYEEILMYLTNDREFTTFVIEAISNSPNVVKITPHYHFNLITADPDDNKFVDCAITAGATYIVSNDKHFKELEHYDFPKVDVRTLREFVDIIRNI